MNTDSLKILVFNNNHRTIVRHKGKDQVFLKKGSNKLMKEKASTLELLPSNY